MVVESAHNMLRRSGVADLTDKSAYACTMQVFWILALCKLLAYCQDDILKSGTVACDKRSAGSRRFSNLVGLRPACHSARLNQSGDIFPAGRHVAVTACMKTKREWNDSPRIPVNSISRPTGDRRPWNILDPVALWHARSTSSATNGRCDDDAKIVSSQSVKALLNKPLPSVLLALFCPSSCRHNQFRPVPRQSGQGRAFFAQTGQSW